MGYESKFIFGLASTTQTHEGTGTRWVDEVAIIDISKAGYDAVGQVIGKAVKTQKDKGPGFFYYADDGATAIVADPYGDPLALVDPQELLEALRKDGLDYRRFDLLHAALTSFVKNFKSDEFQEAVVLHSGY